MVIPLVEEGEMILRSAFWLAVGFAVVAPHGTDFGAAVSEAKAQVTAAGIQAAEQIVASQFLDKGVTLTKAAPRKLSSSAPSADLPMQDSPAAAFVFPRSRPAAMG